MKTTTSGKTAAQVLLLLAIILFNFGPYGLRAAQAQVTCYTLTLAATPLAGGTVTPNPPPNCGSQYEEGTVVTLTASPNAGYSFWLWTGAAIVPTTSSNPGTVTMDSNKSLTANFALKPPHDDFADAKSIGGLPYEDLGVDVRGATTQSINFPSGADPDNIGPCENNIHLNQGNKTVWYEYTPDASRSVIVDTIGSTYDTILAVWTGTENNLNLTACNDEGPSGGSQLSFLASAGSTYYIQAAEYNGIEGGTLGGNLGGTLNFRVWEGARVDVTIGGINRSTRYLKSGEEVRLTYELNAGPVVVQSNSVNIIATLRDITRDANGTLVSVTSMMGLPQSLISDTYVFPVYTKNNSVTGQLLVGNISGQPTTVTVAIGGVIGDRTYNLGIDEEVRLTYELNAGPVVVQSNNGDIIATLRDITRDANGALVSVTSMMGLPQSLISDTYVFPVYTKNNSVTGQLLIGVP